MEITNLLAYNDRKQLREWLKANHETAKDCWVTEGEMPERLQKGLLGFASGVMVAAAVWSLLLPCIEMGASAGKWAVAPAAVGFLLGVGFLLIIDELTPHLHVGSKKPPAIKTNRDSFTNGLGTILHRACIPLWTGAPLISSLLAAYQQPIRSLSVLLASQRRSSAR